MQLPACFSSMCARLAKGSIQLAALISMLAWLTSCAGGARLPSQGGNKWGPTRSSPQNNPVPSVATLSPSSTAAGGADFTLSVTGTGFVPTSVVKWDGADLATTFVDSTELTAIVPAAGISGAGSHAIRVFNPAPGGGSSTGILLPVYLNLATKDLAYDPFGKKMYASVPSAAGANGNSIATIDPLVGTVESAVSIGSEPGKLAISDDGQFLYVSLDGAAAVRRFIISSQTPDIQFSLGSDLFFGPYYVEDMEVAPGSPRTIAVSRKNLGISPRHAGVAIYDDGVQRPTETARHTGSNVIAFSASASMLYGYNNETTEFGFRRMVVDASGVTIIDITTNLISGFSSDIEFDNGRVYASTGAVVDPDTRTLLGTFSVSGYALVRPDSSVGRVFFLTQPGYNGPYQLVAFDPNTFALIGSQEIPGVSGTASSLVRWGTDGLAFRTDANQFFIIRTPLVGQ